MADNLPNLAIVVVDSLARQPFLEALMQDHLPNFRELINETVLYRNAYSPAASTTPSIASLLSGHYSIKFGVRNIKDRIHSTIPLITDILHSLGYTTLAEVTGPLGDEIGLKGRFNHYTYRIKGNSTKWVKTLRKKILELRQPRFLLLHIWEPHLPRYYEGKTLLDYLKTDYEQYIKSLKQVDLLIPDLMEILDDSLFYIMGDHGDKVARSLITNMKLNITRVVKRIPLLSERIGGIAEGTTYAGHGYLNLPEAAETLLITNVNSSGVLEERPISTLDVSADIISRILGSKVESCLGYDGVPLNKSEGRDRIMFSFSCLPTNRHKCKIVAFLKDAIHSYMLDHTTNIAGSLSYPFPFNTILKYINRENLFIAMIKLKYKRCLKTIY